MPMPKPVEESKAFFASVIPVDPRIMIKPMFGNLASFINGNMFAGLYGIHIFVRLPENERLRLLEEEGAAEFSPMQGRPMKEYVVFPEKWREEPDKIKEWIQQSIKWVEKMPEKVSAKKKKAKTTTKD
ncbi:TfoX/Sxy family protein [Neobacillus ginsengisoli]|uniref:TfoX/Sxy family transcriptional regulator of competence genes n=1 Tax=Neobacillus ginsengisoli TaxID=904295 RepID=A0ABT9Y171_9BACI|nr:TfoX/Sxy family protein [Neobacillus ginsengisoli]MDQ0201563.1 TfoX/Sxy family transcriptional regulator of competence genes [Neobacillus ginsengisoli]